MVQPPDRRRVRPVILAGGAGTRLWPLSTADRPKHLLHLLGEQTLFEAVVARVGDRRQFAEPILVAGLPQRAAILELATDASLILFEPVARDSGPAIALAVAAADPSDMLLILPSDQHIADPSGFAAAVDTAHAAAAAGHIVTFGITPDHPATGYGYIRAGTELPQAGVFAVDRFVEKPDAARAAAMIADGDYYWNAGMFLASAATLRAELRRHAPAMLDAAEAALKSAEVDGPVTVAEAAAFAAAPKLSIDYALMEKTDKAAVVPASFGWSDVGDWQAVFGASAHDASGNSVSPGSAAIDSAGCLVRSDGPRVVAIGCEDLVIVATADAVLVVPRGQAQRVREAAAFIDREDKA